MIENQSVIPTIQQMARFARLGYGDGAGPLSPNVYWWRDGTWAQVTELQLDGTTSTVANAELRGVIGEIRSHDA